MEFVVSLSTRISLRAELSLHATIVGVTGPSGAGKSSLLRALAGFEKNAHVTVNWQLALPTEKETKIGIVFQQPMLFPHLNVRGNLALAQEYAGNNTVNFEDVVKGCECAHLLDKPIQALSGGEAQRVALARALLNAPHVLLLDESISALDGRLRRSVLAFIRQFCHANQMRCILVSHDLNDLAVFTDEILLIDRGALAFSGNTKDVINHINRNAASNESNDEGEEFATFSVLEGQLIPNDQGFPYPFKRVQLGNHWIYAEIPDALFISTTPGNTVRLTVPANEVSIDTLTDSHQWQTSIINALPCEIVDVAHPKNASASSVTVTLAIIDEAGSQGMQTLITHISVLSFEKLKLAPGMKVTARFKLLRH